MIRRLSEVPPELQLRLIKISPQLQANALRAVTAVEDDLRKTLSAVNENSQRAFEALAEARGILAGELSRADLSDDRWRYLIDKLTSNEERVVSLAEQTNKLVAQEAKSSRGLKLVVEAMPYVDVVVQAGIRILLSKGRI
ncbi:hypothetical protein P9139_06600 [Curtobacterium flaccumfaciens]|nr:hypothetical protein P9139_06600 [Curtobacterium flaccumfaciens]